MVYLDFETYSPIPIKHGVHKYAEQAEIIVLAWAVDEGPVYATTSIEEIGEVLKVFSDSVHDVCVHNIGFDYTIWKHYQPEICPPLDRFVCSMAQAKAHGLLGGLADLSQIFGLEADSKKEGSKLIRTFCVPNKRGERNKPEDHPEAWAEFLAYAKADIEAMRAVYKKCPKWNNTEKEREIFLLDQTINQRGFRVDRALAVAAIAAVKQEQEYLDAETKKRTNTWVNSATQRDKLLEFILEEYGIALRDMQSGTLQDYLQTDIPEELKELLRIRLLSTMNSTAKYTSLLNGLSSDGRLRGTLQYCGAARTGRWSGRLFQPQNLPRATLPQDDIEKGIAALLEGYADLVVPDVKALCSSALRSAILPSPGHKLVVADLANIEGRYAAWWAGEDWKIKAYQEYDAGAGPDLYRLQYARAFGIAPQDVTPAQRQIGKVMDLMLQYGGGVGAFITGASAYRIDLDQMAEACWPALSRSLKEEVEDFYEWSLTQKRPTYGLSPRTFQACDALKRLYRAAHPAIQDRWGVCQDGMLSASQGNPWNTWSRRRAWVLNKLPSNRYLCYPTVRMVQDQLTYMGIATGSHAWTRLKTYGGKLFENEVQAGARDVLAWSLPRIENAGYKILLTVHDEVITEAPDTKEFSAEGLCALMTQGEPWTKGLPLAAKGYEAYRYRKD